MIQVNISTLKNQLSGFLKKVRKGQDILVMDRDKPVAKISAILNPYAHLQGNALLDELEKRGILTRAKKKLPKDWFEKNPPVKASGSAVDALLAEREEALY